MMTKNNTGEIWSHFILGAFYYRGQVREGKQSQHTTLER